MSEPTNPFELNKAIAAKQGSKRAFGLWSIQDPIPAQLEDEEDLKDLFKTYKFVPFAGKDDKTSHKLLLWYLLLARLSETHRACARKKQTYKFGGKPTAIAAFDPEFYTGEDVRQVSVREQIEYRDALKRYINFVGGITETVRRMDYWDWATGNVFAELSMSEVNGEGRVSIEVKRVTNVLYYNTRPDELRVVGISPKWTPDYIKKHPPRMVPIFPASVIDSDGVERTMFHLKQGQNEWYGRPASEGADVWKYFEVQQSLYLVRQTGNDFTGRLVIEIEEDDASADPLIDNQQANAAGAEDFSKRFNESYTNQGENPNSVIITTRPFGARPMFVHNVPANTNQEWFKVMGEQAAQKIMEAHECTPRFMGRDVSNGFSVDAFSLDYVVNMAPVISSERERLLVFLNQILSAAWAMLGMEQMNQYSLWFTDLLPADLTTIQRRADNVGQGNSGSGSDNEDNSDDNDEDDNNDNNDNGNNDQN